MLIADIYSPVLLQGDSAEEAIFSNELNDLYEEIRRVIFDTKVIISTRKTLKKGKDTTGAPGLAPALNDALAQALTSLGWAPLKAPGGDTDKNTLDWYKSKKSRVIYAPGELGIGLEIQFGNNYQFNEDIKRLSEAFISGQIQAGICIVASDVLSKHKADRGAFFSDAKNKLDRHYQTLYGAQARRIPPIMIIGIQHDGYNEDKDGYFEITPIKYERKETTIIPTEQEKLHNAEKIKKETNTQ